MEIKNWCLAPMKMRTCSAMSDQSPNEDENLVLDQGPMPEWRWELDPRLGTHPPMKMRTWSQLRDHYLNASQNLVPDEGSMR